MNEKFIVVTITWSSASSPYYTHGNIQCNLLLTETLTILLAIVKGQ